MENEIICYCSNITKDEIVTAIKNGNDTLDGIRKSTGACTIGKCTVLSPHRKCCSGKIIEIINENQ